jgi:hypothetical protein
MRTAARAKVEEEIAALAKEVGELRRKRGTGLPDVDTLVAFILAVYERERGGEVAGAVDAHGLGALAEAVGELQVAPAAEALKASVAAVFQAAAGRDYPAYRRDSEVLREALTALLELRAPKWRHLWQARDLYPSSWQSKLDPMEHIRKAVPQLNRWEVLIWAGKALACAQEDLWLWWLWQAGQREYREGQHQHGQQTASEEEGWQQEVVQHTLPEAEAAIVDGWPVPPDDRWPEGNTKALLCRLREWQAKQAAGDVVAAGAGGQ